MDETGNTTSTAARTDKRLADTIAYKMILAMNLMVRPFVEEHSRRYSLTLSEWRAMIALAAQPGMSGEDIAQMLYMEKMTVSRSLRSMEKSGRVVRSKDPNNLKRNEWQLTDTGWKLFNSIAEQALERQENLMSVLSAKEKAALSRTLDKLLR